MARQRVDPHHRRRVAQACDSCKRRKEKCNGALPCGQCKSRHRDDTCIYTKHNRTISRETGSRSAHNDSEVHVALPALKNAIAPLPDGNEQAGGDLASPHAETNASRILRDPKGKPIYVGESASLSFLQTVRSAVAVAVGPCSFTNDPLTRLMIENTPSLHFQNAQEVSLDTTTAHSLADQFFVASSGTLDLFDPSWLTNEVSHWIEHPSQRSEPRSAIIYLCLAIGAQGGARNTSDELIAEQCFAYGRKLAIFTLMDDPSLSMIQAFALITYYLIAACRRNSAFIHLGTAVRAAYTLGIHLHETNSAFAREEGMCRERAWKSLRVCDLFLSASLGRPPATSESFCNIPWALEESTFNTENPSVDSQISSAIFRICNVMERILVGVYSKKAITLELAKSISKEHRQWTEALPQMLKIDGLEESDTVSCSAPRHGSRIVMMAYYYSIVLLTRPFLTFQIRLSRKSCQWRGDASARADLITYADACIDSAIKGIDLAYEDVYEHGAPKRQPLVINSVFISALCLGLAYLGDYDRQSWPLSVSLDRAVAILTHLGNLNPQSAQHADICRLLIEATTLYASKRNDALLKSHCQSVRNVFGDLRAPPEPECSRQQKSGSDVVLTPSQPVLDLSSNSTALEMISPSSLDSILLQPESSIPTSDTLPGHIANAHRDQYHDDREMAIMTQHCINTDSLGSLSESYFMQDVPLFYIANDVAPATYF
ncbi:hypothetical protein GGI35DRAFT_478416 [Trichoderma velutinum]